MNVTHELLAQKNYNLEFFVTSKLCSVFIDCYAGFRVCELGVKDDEGILNPSTLA